MEKYIYVFKKALKEAEDKLQCAENILKKNGVKTPSENIRLERKEKIKIPRGYIRTTKLFAEMYKIETCVLDEVTQKNISYALQTTDFFNYLLNRFDIGLSVGQLFIKYALINAYSIAEAFLFKSLEKLHSHCISDGKVCIQNEKCEYYVKNPKGWKFRVVVDEICKTQLLDLAGDDIFKLKKIRDNVHIHSASGNEFLSGVYTLENYNNIIKVLYKIKNEMAGNIKKYEERRNKGCCRAVSPGLEKTY